MHHTGRYAFTHSTAIAVVVVASVYFVGTQVGLRLTPGPQPVSVLWPPNALLLGALLLAPQRLWAWCVLAILPVHFATQYLHGIAAPTSVGWYVTNMAEALLGAYVLRRLRPTRELFNTLAGFGIFVLVCVVGATGITSFLDAAVVIVTGSGHGYWEILARRFVSNALATLTLVPAIVSVGTSSITKLRATRPALLAEGALLALATFLVIDLFFSRHTGTQATIPSLIYTVLPLMFWAALRFGPIGVSILQVVATSAVLWVAVHHESFADRDVWSIQMLLAMLSVLSLSLAVVVREIRRLQSLHTAVLKSIPDAVAIVDQDGVVIETNEVWDAAGRHESRFDGVARDINYLECHRLDGERAQEVAALIAGLRAVLAGVRKRFEMEYCCRILGQTRWFMVATVPLHGERHGAVITHTDITNRKRADAETLRVRDELAHSGRVMTMGMLSASLTHELSQPLAAVLGNAQAAKRLVGRGQVDVNELDSILTDVLDAGRRASSILRRLRGWFKNGHDTAQPLSLNAVVTDVLQLLQGDLLRRGVSVVGRLSPSLPAVKGDRLQLQQVVLNLILNSCDAMRQTRPDDRRIIVRTGSRNGHVQLSVEDSGTGFPPDRLSTVFELFDTTKEAGLGLGLALCRQIVHAHEGELTAANNEGPGATVSCLLPSIEEPPVEAAS